jgi:hypothetical protein
MPDRYGKSAAVNAQRQHISGSVQGSPLKIGQRIANSIWSEPGFV